MANVNISHVYNATADHIWSVIGDPAALASWHPAIVASPCESGARTCTLADGGVVKEEITSRDVSTRSYTYRIIESPLPMTDYISSIRVEPLAGGGAKVTWAAEFQPAGIERAKLEEMLGGLYRVGLDALEARL